MSEGVNLLLFQLRAVGLPEPETEVMATPAVKRWRMDLAWPDRKLAIEVHGGIWTGGRHVRGGGFAEDRRKINAAILAGWRVLEFPTDEITSGAALTIIEQAYWQEGYC